MNRIQRLYICFAFILGITKIFGQVVSTEPAFPIHNQQVTIIFDASKGNRALENCQCVVYAHAGVVTNRSATPTSWRYVIGNWGTDDSRVKMTSLGNNKYSLTYNIRSFHNVPANEVIEKMAFVFRNANGSLVGRNADGSDIFTPVYASGTGLSLALLSPELSSVVTKVERDVPISIRLSKQADIKIEVNDAIWYEANNLESLDTLFRSNIEGDMDISITAINGTDTAKADFRAVVLGENRINALPVEALPGVIVTESGTLLFTLQAPGKEHVLLRGNFNNWTPSSRYQFSQTPDGQYFWFELDNVPMDQPLLYQFQVDGSLVIADPFSILVLDPDHDPFIPSKVYPNLPSYPVGKTKGIVSYYPLEEEPFEWIQHTFIRPEEQDLVIYELLLRDFVSDHSYITLIDTLDYLQNLGVNVIQLMPVQEFEGNISWGYNPSFHMALDKYYGTRNAFKAFVDAAHRRGIAVIVDVVYNHAFSQSPLCQLYWDGQNNRPSLNNPWLNPTDRHPFSVGYDFNHESKATQDWLDRVMRYWMQEFRIDGFRFDLSKGFTQRLSTSVDAWGRYDASRIALWRRISNVIREVDPSFYIILEHFAENSEEQVLAADGMMVWGNMTHEYNEATMGYTSDFRWADYKRRNFSSPKVVSYMESHDEERLMVKNKLYGNSSGNYSTRQTDVALQRIAAATLFHYTIPGPKMLWQFGDLGYDFSINYCTDGTINEACRTGPKPIRWDYFIDDSRRSLYNATADIIYLKTVEKLFDTEIYDYNLSSKIKRIRLDAPSAKSVAVANFDVVSGTIQMNFHQEGWWYEYFSGDSLWVTNKLMTQNLQPGEYRLYLSRKIEKPSKDMVNNVIHDSVTEHIHIFPNPGSNQITINSQVKPIRSVTLIGFDGRVLLNHELDNCEESCRIEIPQTISSGVYILLVETPQEIIPLKWVKD
jgi:1,4-alpha-glucan branching enzyme